MCIRHSREYGDKTPSSWSNLNLNMTHQGLRGREIKLFNDSTPYVSYAEMQSSEFLTKLNKNYQSGSSYKSFSTVTITEQGQNIDGKYSFPGNDTALQGLNLSLIHILCRGHPGRHGAHRLRPPFTEFGRGLPCFRDDYPRRAGQRPFLCG